MNSKQTQTTNEKLNAIAKSCAERIMLYPFNPEGGADEEERTVFYQMLERVISKDIREALGESYSIGISEGMSEWNDQ